jgi:hypothetical protein
MTKERLQDAQQWVRHYYLDNPAASVDDVAREAQRCHLALHKSDISRIRREVRARISQHTASSPVLVSQPSTRPAVGFKVRRPEAVAAPVAVTPFNGIKIALPQSDPEAGLSAQDVAAREVAALPPPPPVAIAPQVSVKPAMGRDEKTQFLWDYAEKHPETAPKEMNKIIIARFGSGFYVPVVCEALKYARAIVGLPQTSRPSKAGQAKRLPVAASPKQTTHDAVIEAIRSLAAALKQDKASGTLTLKVDEDGTFRWSSDLRKNSQGTSRV